MYNVYTSPKYGKKERLLHNIDKTNIPFDTVYVDHLGPLEKSKQFYRDILVVIGGYIIFFNYSHANQRLVMKPLTNYCTVYNRSRRLISDGVSCFTCGKLGRFTDKDDIKQMLITTGVRERTDRSNCIVSRTLVSMLTNLCSSTNNWDKALHEAESAMNCCC